MRFQPQLIKRLSIKSASWIIISSLVFAVLFFRVAQAQDNRYVNPQHGISFQPPSGWTPDSIVRYLGPQREDGTWPVLTLITQDSTLDLSDKDINALAEEMTDNLAGQGMEEIQVTDRHKRTIAGLVALQMDLAYKQQGIPIKQRQVYIPVNERNRTFLFTLVDAAKHFDESVDTAENAINSFATAGLPVGDTKAKAPAGGGGRAYTILLVALGIAALAIVIGAAYLLLRKQAASQKQ